MSALPNRWSIGAALALAACFVWVLHLVSASTALQPDVAWVAVVWVAGFGVAVLSAGHVTRAVRGLGLWLVCLPLATLTHGTAAMPMWALIVALVAFGLARFLNVPDPLDLVREPIVLPDIVITDLDVQRLTLLMAALPGVRHAAVTALAAELARARVVPSVQVPADVVTMNTRLVFEDIDSGVRQEAVLVYPRDEDLDRGRLSVLGPVGSALLGLRVGQSIDWKLAVDDLRRYRIVNVLYQPEAAGDFHL